MTDESQKIDGFQLADLSECIARSRELAEGVRKNAETSGFASPVVDAMSLQAYQIALSKELDAYHDATCKSCREHEAKTIRLWPALVWLVASALYLALALHQVHSDPNGGVLMGHSAGLLTAVGVVRGVMWWQDRDKTNG